MAKANKPIRTSDLNINLSLKMRTALDNAHNDGFIEYCKRIPWNPGKASNAMVDLPRSLVNGRLPSYDDPYIAGAYQAHYQMTHCAMAFRTYCALFEKTGVPPTLHICDVGAGADAGLIGLFLALEKRQKYPAIFYVAIEPSDQMNRAGQSFRQYLSLSSKNHATLHYKRFKNVSQISRRPNAAMRIVTAFHLSLKYNSDRYVDTTGANASKSLQDALKLVDPDCFLMTCHGSKIDHLKSALSKYRRISDYNYEECHFPSLRNTLDPSKFYTDTAISYGFRYPDGRSITTRGNYRFDKPKDAVLVSGFDNRN